MATEQAEIVWGLTVAQWGAFTGIATAALTLATVGVAWVAWYQIGAAREESKKTRTLEVVSRYDNDPVMDRALRRMARGRDNGTLLTNPRDYRLDIVAVLNYLETIAIGIKQQMYIADMVRDFMEPIVASHIDEIRNSQMIQKIGLETDDFGHIFELAESWKPKAQTHL